MPRGRSFRFLSARAGRLCLLSLALIPLAPAADGGFSSTEVFLPAVGRIGGQGGLQAYTTIWITNLTGAAETFTLQFLRQGQPNPNPASFSDTLSPGQTKVYENFVEARLGLSGVLGAARVRSTGEVLVAERIYNQEPGDDLGATEGLFFAGIPKSFSIVAGQSASIQGVNQGGPENFRYNFALVETGGGSPTVNVQLFDGSGVLLGQKAYALHPFEQQQPNVADLFAGIATTNARITATVTGGSGAVLLAGAQVANESLDSSGFEMSFRDQLLGSGGTAGVTSLNGLTGGVTIAHGANTSVNVNGQTITIDAVAGSGTGLTAVAHDNSLTGSGTVGVPIGIANGQVVRSLNGLHDAVTLAAGSNVTLTPSGSTLTIAATGGGGLSSVSHDSTLHGDGTGGSPLRVAFPLIHDTETNDPIAVLTNHGDGGGVTIGVGGTHIGLLATSASGFGIEAGGATGLVADGSDVGIVANGPIGIHATGSPGVLGDGDPYASSDGVDGTSSSTGRSGVYGVNSVSGGYGVYGRSTNSGGVAVAGSGDNGGKAAHFYAGDVYVDHNVHVTGNVSKAGGSFEIDHPIDPAGKLLFHSFVESPDMMNIYNGIATLDASGTATIDLPDWFEALNRDFRYQLTALDTPQPGLFVSRRIEAHRFGVAGGVPGADVSWQVTGIRHDPWADAHRIPVEVEKSAGRKGLYLHPELYGAPPEKQINREDEAGSR